MMRDLLSLLFYLLFFRRWRSHFANGIWSTSGRWEREREIIVDNKYHRSHVRRSDPVAGETLSEVIIDDHDPPSGILTLLPMLLYSALILTSLCFPDGLSLTSLGTSYPQHPDQTLCESLSNPSVVVEFISVSQMRMDTTVNKQRHLLLVSRTFLYWNNE